uniref:2-amino-4-hydroxy-6-hydroxymethyldihydropteridine diphosphokinase n=1 Tax=uncultured bacterium TB303_p TaxID=1552134 RepID=A0A0K0LBG3_9BACT|nr:dialkyl PEs hydrolase [uncultured bacterium TB303_p]
MAHQHRYLIALGSNRRHHLHGEPRKVLRAALRALERADIEVIAASPTYMTDPIGPSSRRYANSAAVISTALAPQKLLRKLKSIEADFGHRIGQRWSSRTLDLDIILWDGGAFHSNNLTIPHPLFRQRDFVLRPANQIARNWVDPLTGLAVRHLFTHFRKKLSKYG